MKGFIFACALLVPCVAHAQFFQQFPQQLPAQQPVIVYPQQPQHFPQPCPQGGGRSDGDHTLLQILAMQNMFSQQTSVQQGWHVGQDAKLSQILAQQEAYRTAAAQRDWFEQILRGQTRERDMLQQRDLFERLQQTRQQPFPFPQPLPQPPPRRGILGRRACVDSQVLYNVAY